MDSSGNVYVTGKSNGIGQLFPSDYDYATIKYDSTGVQHWVTRYIGPGNGDDVASSLALDSSRNVYVTGYSLGSGTGLDYATIKYDSTGVQQWIERYNGRKWR
ncbi:MAG: SBBP repeat-containing protein [Bacteroidetes bacterium]|nr:SBBP repeat-containing protein [Bacteroidota bacterium]